MSQKFSTILFDVDGTLLDTSEYVFGAFNYALAKNGEKLVTKAQVDAVMGTALPMCYEIFAPNGDNIKLRAFHKEFQINNAHLSKPFPETLKVLTALKRKKLKLGAVTNRSNTAHQTLEAANLLKLLDVVITAEDVKNPKPHAEPLLKAISNLGVPKDEVLYVGDTEIDIQTGKNAKIKTAGLTNSFIGEKMKDFEPDYLLKDLEDLLVIVS